MTRRLAHAAIIAFVLVLAIAPAAFAGKTGGKPSGSGGSSLRPVPMDGATQAAHYGRITFDVKTTVTARPQVGLRCFQGSNWVYDAYVGYYPEYPFDQWFTLKSNYWVDGVWATCDARLFYNDRRGRQVVLATTSFPVAP